MRFMIERQRRQGWEEYWLSAQKSDVQECYITHLGIETQIT